MPAERLEDIYQAIGRLTAGLEAAQSQSERLEAAMSDGLRRLELMMKETLQEVRERYHDQINATQKKLLDIDNELVDVKRTISVIQQWQTNHEIRATTNLKWVSSLTAIFTTIITLAIEVMRAHL